MCGILALFEKGVTAKKALDALASLEYRGYDSCGLFLMSQADRQTIKSVGNTSKLGQSPEFAAIKDNEFDVVLGHTRWATHGGATQENAHPHASTDVQVVHNGIIENFAEFKTRFSQSGRVFVSETDTEVIAHFIAEKLNENLSYSDIAKQAMSELEGDYSFCAYIESTQSFIAVCKGSPLLFSAHADGLCVVSDQQAMHHFCEDFTPLRDGEYLVFSDGKLEFSNEMGQALEPRKEQLQQEEALYTKGSYATFMERELNDTVACVDQLAKHIDTAFTAIRSTVLSNDKRIIVFGCGGALIAAEAIAYWINRYTGKHAVALPSSEVLRTYGSGFLPADCVGVAVSQSGETMETLKACRLFVEKDLDVISILNNTRSEIGRLSTVVIPCRSGVESSVASTKAFIGQLCCGGMLVNYIRGQDNAVWLKEISSALSELRDTEQPNLQKTAHEFAEYSSLIVTGFETGYFAAKETALKLKEICYIHAEAIHTAEFKHGPLALVDADTGLLFFSPNADSEKISAVYLNEITARGAKVAQVVNTSSTQSIAFQGGRIGIPDLDEIQSGIVSAHAGQWLAFHIATLRGCPIDQPRNLAKSVTVV